MAKFFRDGKWEDVQEERWQWVAVYNDNTFLKQFDGEGIFHQFREIDQSRLKIFSMVSGMKHIDVEFQPDMKPIHFYQVYGKIINGQNIQTKLYCFGYAVRGRNHIFVILPDDNIAITDDAEKVTVLM